MLLQFFGFISVNAQDIKFGGKAGSNITSFSGESSGALGSKVAFHIGIMAEIEISEKFAFQPELVYSAQGTRFVFSSADFNLDYINMPLIIKYVVKRFALEAGPQLGYLLSAKLESFETSADIIEGVQKFDFAIGLGTSYRFNSGVDLALRYNVGLSNLNNSKMSNNVFQVSIGYFFN